MSAESPVTVLTGARQVGKSTLLLHEFDRHWKYISLDDYDTLTQARRDPRILIESAHALVFDEAHRVPDLFPAIKMAIDSDKAMRVVLSGSANLLLMAKISESLAGRAEFLELGPMTVGEMRGNSPPDWLNCIFEKGTFMFSNSYTHESDLAMKVWRGGMPEILRRNVSEQILRWREGYVTSYLERDLRQLSQIDNLTDFRRLMKTAALWSGQVMNKSAIARDLGLSQPTTHRYLNLLDVSALVGLLPAYGSNRAVRLVKSPKLIWHDSGIAAHLAGYFSADDLLRNREWGGMLECFVYSQLYPLCCRMSPTPRIYYWRTRKGEEVDFVIEQGRKLLAIEVKAGSRVGYDDTRGLQTFMQSYPQTTVGIVLYSGSKVEKMSDKIFAVPLASLWQT